MKIAILYDNTVFLSGLKPDWGFSCLVETHNRNILFDTSSNGSILLENMKKLHIDPLSINEVFVSHPHFDHIGGLSAFLNEFELFKDLGVICPTHCTKHITEIKSLYPEKYIEGEVGKIIEI